MVFHAFDRYVLAGFDRLGFNYFREGPFPLFADQTVFCLGDTMHDGLFLWGEGWINALFGEAINGYGRRENDRIKIENRGDF